MPFPSLCAHLHLATSSRRQQHCDFMSHYCALFATHHQYFFPGLVYIVTLSCVCFSAFLSQVQNLQLSGNSSHSSFRHVCAQSWVELLTYRPTSSFARASNCGHFPTILWPTSFLLCFKQSLHICKKASIHASSRFQLPSPFSFHHVSFLFYLLNEPNKLFSTAVITSRNIPFYFILVDDTLLHSQDQPCPFRVRFLLRTFPEPLGPLCVFVSSDFCIEMCLTL